jgi:hypothetical protein
MSMLEALAEISREGAPWMWARPVSWRGYGMGICFDPPTSWKVVPTARGGAAACLPMPSDCFGEWELVTPETVNLERRNG